MSPRVQNLENVQPRCRLSLFMSKYLTAKISRPDCIISCKRNSKGSRMEWNDWIWFLFQGISLLSIFNRFIFCRHPSSETSPEIDNLLRWSTFSHSFHHWRFKGSRVPWMGNLSLTALSRTCFSSPSNPFTFKFWYWSMLTPWSPVEHTFEFYIVDACMKLGNWKIWNPRSCM